jgi:diguanylate cyclase (GGDEF)-like protein/PAS domain S-box-containing protein
MWRETKNVNDMPEEKTAMSQPRAAAPHVPPRVVMQLSLMEGLYDGVYLVGPDGRIAFWNRGAERITGFRASDVIGVECCEVIRHHDYRGQPLCPRKECPVQSSRARNNGIREALVYIQHRLGRRIPVISRSTTVHGSDDYQGVLEIFSDNRLDMVRKKRLSELKRLALIDPLTGLGNRRYGEAILSLRLQELSENSGRAGILMADLDHFKHVNDVHGHQAGDEVLRTVGRIFSAGLRAVDTVARWGGEEFLFVLSDLGRNDLAMVAEKLRTGVERAVIRWQGGRLYLTVSLGGCMVVDGDTRESVLEKADRRLYASKREGRNQVTLSDEPAGPAGRAGR